ncbi:MAG TPA: cytochrome c oxidase accessory protein CcoG [Chitinophagaceae bacterium]|nr:cytochrome c oxidase accessory protein CcoG [Chitinophagaceae bacterium]
MKNTETKMSSPQKDSFRDRIATIDEKGKRKWIFAQKPKGKFYNIRSWVSWGFFALFFAIPFIKLNDRPLFLFNIPESEFIIFGKIFWPQDFVIFGLTMVTFIVFIVLFTAAFGRVFCGWVCPQTIFMEMLFRKVEYLIDGDAGKQKVLRNAPWTTQKIWKRLFKHAVFFLLSFIIANTFLAYIIGVDQLKEIITEPISEHVGGFLSILIFSFVFYWIYAFFREQVCTVVCPYGRLQSVLMDRNSLIVAYDYKRGEPRGKYTKNEEAKLNLGDCIDCFQCVKVCPTGIDIRNGTQMECVACTACIDACDVMMDATNKPRGLIRYASEAGIADKKKLQYTGRMKFYTVLLIALTAILSLLIFSRKDIDGTIIRTKGLTYQQRGTDSLSNLFNINIINKTRDSIPLTLKLEGNEAAYGKIELVGTQRINLHPEDQATGSFFIVLPTKNVNKRTLEVKIGLYNGEKRLRTLSTNFTGPFKRY